jgi:hypothetical protein
VNLVVTHNNPTGVTTGETSHPIRCSGRVKSICHRITHALQYLIGKTRWQIQNTGRICDQVAKGSGHFSWAINPGQRARARHGSNPYAKKVSSG